MNLAFYANDPKLSILFAGVAIHKVDGFFDEMEKPENHTKYNTLLESTDRTIDLLFLTKGLFTNSLETVPAIQTIDAILSAGGRHMFLTALIVANIDIATKHLGAFTKSRREADVWYKSITTEDKERLKTVLSDKSIAKLGW